MENIVYIYIDIYIIAIEIMFGLINIKNVFLKLREIKKQLVKKEFLTLD